MNKSKLYFFFSRLTKPVFGVPQNLSFNACLKVERVENHWIAGYLRFCAPLRAVPPARGTTAGTANVRQSRYTEQRMGLA